MLTNTLPTLATFGEFSNSGKEKGTLAIDCSFERTFQVECIVQNLKGNIIKHQTFSVDEHTKELKINFDINKGDHFHAWFYIENQAFVREIKFASNKKDQTGNSLARLFKFFT